MPNGSTGFRSPSIEVVEALADADGVDSTDLDYSLHDFVDPDALDALMEGGDTDWKLRVMVANHIVTVDSEWKITVDGNTY